MEKSGLGHSLLGFSTTFQSEEPNRLGTIISLIKQGNLAWLHQFLQPGECNIVDKQNKNLLFHACYYNQPTILLYLLMVGVPINHVDQSNNNLFHVCGYTGHLSCLDVLLHRLRTMRQSQTLNRLRKLHKDHDIKKSDYKNGEMHVPASTGKLERFKMFQQAVLNLYQQQLIKEFEDYTVALTLQDKSNKRTPLHLAGLNRYQRCYQTLKRMLRDEQNDNESFRDYIQMWSEIFPLLDQQAKKRTVDPRYFGELQKELESVVGKFQTQRLDEKYKKLFQKQMARISCLTDKNNHTPLHIASENGHASIVHMLIKMGADTQQIDQNSKTKKVIEYAINDSTRRQITDLCKASEKGENKCISLLINCGQEVNTKQTIYGLTPLIKSVIYSSETANLQPVNLLLSSGADVDIQDVNGWTSLHKACEKGNVQLVELLLANKASTTKVSNKGYTPLHIAAMNNQSKIIQVLLKVKNIDVNCRDEQGCTPLHLAAKKGANLAIEKLMSHPECDLYVIDKKKWSALHYATFSQHKQTIMILLKYDADSDRLRSMTNCQGKIARQLSNSGDIRASFSHIWKASSEGKLDEVRRLILQGADKDAATTKLKRTPLMLAVINGHTLMVKYLLDQGADTYAQDSNGKSAQTYAKELKYSSGTYIYQLDKTRKLEADKIIKLLVSN